MQRSRRRRCRDHRSRLQPITAAEIAAACYSVRTLTESVSQTSPNKISRSHLALLILTLLAPWFVLCRQLSGEWSVNEQYSYGWFVPFFAAFLFWLRWEDRPSAFAKATARSGVDGLPSRSLGEGWRAEDRGRRRIAGAISILALLTLFPVRLFEVANPDWRPVDWTHAAVVIGLTLLVIWAAGGKPWLRHFAFPVCFFFVAVPWITPIEEPIVQGLMRTVAAVATETITLFGVPAHLEGNLIRVSTGLVGVNEACSGVRSLQTSLMIGLLFGELKRLSVGKRLALVLGALAIAVLANFGRAFFLVWIAAAQTVSAVDRWHDAAGYTIVAVVFIGSLALAAFLSRDGKRRQRTEDGGQRADRNENAPISDVRPPSSVLRLPSPFLLHPSSLILSILWLLAVEIGVESWYRVHERGLIARERWSARWPETAKDFREIHIDETTRRILRFDQGRGAMWKIQKSEDGSRRTDDGGRRTDGGDRKTEDSALLYFFRWRAGSNSALLANLHRPDVCLPASGWIQAGDYGIRSYPVSPRFSLPFRHLLFSQGSPGPANGGRQRFAHAFYCLREDRVRTESDASLAREEFAQEPTEWSRSERIGLVLQGRRHLGQQVMEFVLLESREERAEEAEARFAQELPELIQVESRK
jgi:exosortase